MTEPDDVTAGSSSERSGERSGRSQPGGTAGPPDDAHAALAREVYWAEDGTSSRSLDTGSLRDRLRAFADQMQLEQGQLFPVGEGSLTSASGWRRRTKFTLWRLMRFSTVRYDRLLSELASLNAELAERLTEDEREIARLREELRGSEGGDGS